MAANKDAIIAALEREGIEFRELENPSGWQLEMLSPVEGSEMERLLRTIDTQTNIICVIIPNVGLSIATEGFDEEYHSIPAGEVIHETDEPIEEESEAIS